MNDPILYNDPNLATYMNSIFDIIRFCQTEVRPRLANTTHKKTKEGNKSVANAKHSATTSFFLITHPTLPPQ